MTALNRTPWWRTRWFAGLAVLVLALAGIFFAVQLMESATLPIAELTTMEGKVTDLTMQAAGKPIVVNLWATWCPPCRLELPFLLAAQRQEPGITFVFVDQGEDATTVGRYLSGEQLALANVLLDMGSKLGREIGSNGLPVTLFYDSTGRIADSHVGAISPALLDAKLARLRSISR